MDDSNATLSDFGIVLRHQLRFIVYIAGPLFAIFLGVALGWPSAYESTSVIRIDQRLSKDNRAIDTYAEYYMETLASQVLSTRNLRAWVDEFDLYQDEDTWSEADKADELESHIDTTIMTTTVIDPGTGREREVVTGFEVSYRSPSPAEAQEITAKAAETFIEEDHRSKLARSQQEIDLYKKEADQYRAKIEDVEARMAGFKERNSRRLPELAQLNWNGIDRVERDIESSQMQIDNLKRERVILQSQIGQIPKASDEAIRQLAALQNEYVQASSIYKEDHPRVVALKKQLDTLTRAVDSSAAIPVLRQQQDEIDTALAEARQKYSEDHPEVQQLVRAQAALKERIASLAAKQDTPGGDLGSTNELYVQLDTQIKAIDSQISGLEARVKDLRQKRGEYEQLLTETPQVEREYQDLSRDLTNARELYDQTQEKQRDAELSLALSQNGSRNELILARAAFLPKEPSWPPRAAIVLLGIVVALGMSAGIAALRETTDMTVRSSREAFDLCHVPPIALIPEIRNRADRVMGRLRDGGILASICLVGAIAFAGAHFL